MCRDKSQRYNNYAAIGRLCTIQHRLRSTLFRGDKSPPVPYAGYVYTFLLPDSPDCFLAFRLLSAYFLARVVHDDAHARRPRQSVAPACD